MVKAQHKSSGRVVALKRVWQSGNPFDGGSGGCGDDGGGALGGLPQALLREVHALRAVQHANVVQLLHTFKLVREGFCMAFRRCAMQVASTTSWHICFEQYVSPAVSGRQTCSSGHVLRISTTGFVRLPSGCNREQQCAAQC